MSELRKSFGVTHGIAECLDCPWHNEMYKNAQATAAIHARRYGHKVDVEIGVSGYYDGRPEAKP